jgi:predicted RNase H-like nuclease (RuvC/YqgF family)
MLTRPTEEDRIIHKVVMEQKITKSDFLKLYAQLEEKEAKNQALQRKLNAKTSELHVLRKIASSLGKKNENFDRRVDALLRFKEDRLRLQEKEIQRLQRTVSGYGPEKIQLFHFISLLPKHQLLKKIDNLSASEWDRKQKTLSFSEGDILLVKDPSQYSESVLKRITGLNLNLTSFAGFPKFMSYKLATAVIFSSDLVMDIGDFALVSPTLIAEKLHKVDLNRVIASYREEKNRE